MHYTTNWSRKNIISLIFLLYVRCCTLMMMMMISLSLLTVWRPRLRLLSSTSSTVTSQSRHTHRSTAEPISTGRSQAPPPGAPPPLRRLCVFRSSCCCCHNVWRAAGSSLTLNLPDRLWTASLQLLRNHFRVNIRCIIEFWIKHLFVHLLYKYINKSHYIFVTKSATNQLNWPQWFVKP